MPQLQRVLGCTGVSGNDFNVSLSAVGAAVLPTLFHLHQENEGAAGELLLGCTLSCAVLGGVSESGN